MAAVITGTPIALTFNLEDPVGQSITVESDATAVYAFWAYWCSTTGSKVTVASTTLNGIVADQSFAVDTTNGIASGVLVWYSPATGSKTLDPNYDNNNEEGGGWIVACVKDGDLSGARDLDADNTTASVTLTTVSGDLVLKFDQRFGASPSLTSGWTSGQTHTANQEGYRLSYKTAAGSSEVCASEDLDESSIVAVSIIPLSAGGGASDFNLPWLTIDTNEVINAEY